VQPLPTHEGGVDEGLGDVQPPAGGPQHPLHEVADGLVVEDRRRELGAPRAGDEDPARFVDPDLLDGRVVQVLLERPQAGHGVEQFLRDAVGVAEGGDEPGERALVVVVDGLRDEGTDTGEIGCGVDATAAREFAHLVLQQRDGVVHPVPLRHIPRVPLPHGSGARPCAANPSHAPVDGPPRASHGGVG